MLTENKSRVVQVRLTEKDYTTLNTIAQRVNMTVSQYVRLLIQGALTTAKTQAKGTPDNAHK